MSAVAESAQRTRLASLVPMAHVADVRKSAEFYELLGFEVKNTFEQDGQVQWAWLQNGGADLMLARSGRPMNPGAQDILFYLYVPDVAAYRAQLEGKGVKVGPLSYPFYSPRGEFRIDDADGYTLFVSHED
ncbi:MAG TPA: VOC family protein [Candidatus Angelobacter sp.]|nr:VOC family protein [Candidatus Angelobacter sp.]